MALARNRRRERTVDYWPGFVDALSTLLLAIMFLLTVFVLAQFFLSREISGRDQVLNRLNSQINELTQLLALERSGKQDLEDNLANMMASLSEAEADRSRLQELLASGSGASAAAENKIGILTETLNSEKKVSQRALSQVELLNQQISALRTQLAALEDALEVSESKDRQTQARIADLGRRLNVALAQRVQELNRYRSDFFGRLREILASREDVRVVGDRFVFQSEVLFPSGGNELNAAGKEQMAKLATAINELAREIPEEINWVLRVDGHTDDVPLSGNGRYADNWELSSARATSVVKYLVSQGVPANRLVAAGFGEFQPIAEGDTDADRATNRRIELKLTER
ncbi:peptidoglycan -binding protein [Hoeflea sp. G2-23]|uniref:Peptidoglycan -binding protein n=1 Tax=Hoeflea algicola TaxID=2983763 RepID=A0ABT3ZA99_9HYPH|nr:peptidoglycan -binding protein [Hoeflea algicola]MCY0148249.1 peptidoglycan -binding protein [Hoeflea algicola]